MESLGTTSKQRRDKTLNKAQQEEEEERGKINILFSFNFIEISSFRNNQSLRW
jgi:hypothetical protein